MPIRVAALVVSEADRATLESWLRSPSLKSGLARRAGIVLLAAEALSNTEIAERVGVSRPTVLLWRGRYETGGVGALDDLERSGRPRQVEQGEVVAATLTKPPARLGVTHWSSRLLAKELGIGHATVAKSGITGTCSRGGSRPAGGTARSAATIHHGDPRGLAPTLHRLHETQQGRGHR